MVLSVGPSERLPMHPHLRSVDVIRYGVIGLTGAAVTALVPQYVAVAEPYGGAWSPQGHDGGGVCHILTGCDVLSASGVDLVFG